MVYGSWHGLSLVSGENYYCDDGDSAINLIGGYMVTIYFHKRDSVSPYRADSCLPSHTQIFPKQAYMNPWIILYFCFSKKGNRVCLRVNKLFKIKQIFFYYSNPLRMDSLHKLSSKGGKPWKNSFEWWTKEKVMVKCTHITFVLIIFYNFMKKCLQRPTIKYYHQGSNKKHEIWIECFTLWSAWRGSLDSESSSKISHYFPFCIIIKIKLA